MTALRRIILAISIICSPAWADDFAQQFRLQRSDANTFYVNALLGHKVPAQFMVDTGASIVILNHETFAALTDAGAEVTSTGALAARLANGKIKTVKRYRIAALELGPGCQFSDIEVAVMPNKNNILGMNLLMSASPFAIFTNPPRLALSQCDLLATLPPAQ